MSLQSLFFHLLPNLNPMKHLKRLLLFSVLFLAFERSVHGKLMNRSDILNIPFIDMLPPLAAYYTERLQLNVSLYVSYMRMVDKDSEFRLTAKLIWIINWKDKRISNIQDDSYYFNDGQIWTPEIHSWSNEKTDSKVKDHYTDTIAVKKNGEVEAIVFEDYETFCYISEKDIVWCGIGISNYFGYSFNINAAYVCPSGDCIRFSDVFLQMSNESEKWVMRDPVDHIMENEKYYSYIFFDIAFKRNVEVTFHIVDKSPVIFTILILIPFLVPVYSKMRLELNVLTYILGIILIINVQFEFFSLNADKESQLHIFYSASLIFLSISWLWNSLASNIWTSCNHSFELATDSILGRILSAKYVAWIIPRNVLESKSVLMKIIVLVDKTVFLFVGIGLICLIVYAEALVSAWNLGHYY